MDTMNGFALLEFLKGLLFLLPDVAVLIGCIYYLAKSKSSNAWLMTIGAFIGLLVMLFYRIAIPIMTYNSSGSMGYMSMYTITSIIAFVGSVLFAVGFILTCVKAAKSYTGRQS